MQNSLLQPETAVHLFSALICLLGKMYLIPLLYNIHIHRNGTETN